MLRALTAILGLILGFLPLAVLAQVGKPPGDGAPPTGGDNPTQPNPATPEATRGPQEPQSAAGPGKEDLEDLRNQLQARESELAAARAETEKLVGAERERAAAAVDDALKQTQAMAGMVAEAQRRAAIAEAGPTIIAELVTGTTPAEIAASIEAAKAVYQRVAAQLTSQAAAHVPAGASPSTAQPDLAKMSPLDKIRAGLNRNGNS